jgi:hypothetical protein
MVRIEWDPEKDRTNRAKHGLGFEEVRSLFEDNADYLVIYDEEHSDQEDRFVAIGPVARGIVAVVHTERADDVIRIVSARVATRQEEQLFSKYMGGTTS